ncbi:MAG TPA: hypothetical protein VGC19_06145 [Rhodanobacter sp.]
MNQTLGKLALSLLATLPAIISPMASTAQTTQPVPAPASATLARLLDDHTSNAERQQLFADAETAANSGDTEWQYIVGSLLDERSRTLPFPHDPDKARVYLGNAAVHGKLFAMAKMAESELTTGNYQEAMNWAQIYGHYLSLQHTDNRPAKDYLSELLARISERLDSKRLAQVQADVAAFIASNDAAIQNGPQKLADTENTVSPNFLHQPLHRLYLRRAQGSEDLRACFADYLIAFRPDGTVEKTWLVDITPNALALDYLQSTVSAATIPALPHATQNIPLRYVFTSIGFDDGRYHVRGGHVVNGRGI